MTFSEVLIKFLIDFDDDYTLQLTTNDGGVSSNTWTWVASRSAGFEVTTGTPTGSAGETTAINFEAAFDLDLSTGYVTTVQNTNEIVIQSESPNETFIGLSIRNANGDILVRNTDYEVTFEDGTDVVDISNVDFILTRSPHYVSTPFNFATTESATIKLFVWSGDLSSVPSTPNYQVTKPRPSVDYAEFNTDISKIVSDSLEGEPNIDISSTVQIIDSQNAELKWVKYIASYNDPEETIADIEGTLIASSGFGYYLEGVNPTKPTNDILTNAYNRKVDRSGFILLPFVNNGSITSIDIESETGEISATETITSSDNSNKAVQYLSVDVSQTTSDQYIEVTFNPSNNVVAYQIEDECRYDPLQVVFQNKYGFFECMTLFKKRTNTLATTNDTFINSYISNGSFSTTRHQFQKINIQGKETVKCNTGYIKEEENNLYTEALLSKKVYFYENDILIPANIISKTLEFKDRTNDGLINYSIDFEYAFNKVQNV